MLGLLGRNLAQFKNASRGLFFALAGLVVLLPIVLPAAPVFGLTPPDSADTDSIYNNWVNWVAEPACGEGTSGSSGSTANPLSSGSSVYILGDSITERSASAYQAAFQQQGVTANIDASVGRTLFGAGTDGNQLNGVNAIAQDTAEVQSASAIVVALGTNGGDTVQSIDQAIAALRADNSSAPIYWVDTIAYDRTASPGWAAWDQQIVEPDNQAIYSQAASENYQVISWFKTVDPNGDPQHPNGAETDTSNYIDTSDGLGVHPTAGGITALVNLVTSTITGTSASATGGASGASCACSASGGGTVNITITGNNVKDAFNFFTDNGYSATQAAGIVGNLMYESDGTSGDINPTQNENGGGGGFGIAQFTGEELTRMKAWVTAQGEDPNSLQGQLDYLLYDLNTNYPTVVGAIKATSDVDDATQAFEDGYERPANPPASLADRELDANAAYNKYGGSSGSSAGGSTACGSSLGGVNCSSATGDAKILCEAEPFAGVYYEYGGGHQGYAAFIAACPNPASPPNNKPTGGPINGDPDGVSGNPSPCAVDCSALVSIAVDAAFNQTFNWTVEGAQMQGGGSQYWQSIPLTQVQPGDIVTLSEHVEIVVQYNPTTGLLETFGAHETGTQDGQVSSPLNSWVAAYRYTGPGSQ